MRSSTLQAALLYIALTGLVGCTAGEPQPESEGVQQAAVIPNGGFLPWPVVAGEPKWDGTLVDLMAADAFGFCSPWWRTSEYDDTFETDQYLAHLITLMTSSPCPESGPTVPLPEAEWWGGEAPSDAMRWVWGRTQHKECNVDLQANVPAVVEGPALDHDSLIARWSAYDVLSEIWPTTQGQMVFRAASEVGLAGANLCMASRLREQMLSADVLVASGSQQRELLEVIRQRAQLALTQFTLLGLAFTDSGLTGTPLEAWQFLPVLRQYGQSLPTDMQIEHETEDQLGRDYAEALRIYVDDTEELAELVGRSASARSDLVELGGHASWMSSDETWSDASWRGRLLNLLYGGDPLGTAPAAFNDPGQAKSFNAEWGTAAGTFGSFPFSPRGVPHVLSSVSEPEVFALLGLARQADALYLAYDEYDALPNTTRDFLYRAVEANLQREKCLRQDPEATCSFNADDPEIEEVTDDYTSGELWRLFQVTPEHSSQLALVLHEVFRSPSDQYAEGFADRSALLLSGTFEFSDQPPQVQSDEVDRWLHVDPDFGAADLPATLLASRYQANAGFLLPSANFVPLASPGLQGFVLARDAHSEVWAGPEAIQFGQTNAAARYVGAVPVLAAVRDGLLRGKDRAPENTYFKFASEMMGTIETAIGSLSYSMRPKTETVTLTTGTAAPRGCNGLATCTGVVQETAGSDVQVVVDVIQAFRKSRSPDRRGRSSRHVCGNGAGR